MKLYHELAEFYFVIENAHRVINDDISLILRLLRGKTGPSLLDLGCGTGEHLDILSRHGITCTGIDNSADMLSFARNRFPGTAEFLELDMLKIDFYETFDIVTCLFGSFNYIIDDVDVDRVFWNTWRALKPGGIALFEIWNSPPIVRIKNKDLDLVSRTTAGDIAIERERGFMLLEDTRGTVVEVNYRYTVTRKGGTQTLRDRHIMRAYTRDEAESFLGANGFEIREVFSSSSMEPYRDSSNKMLIHAVKP